MSISRRSFFRGLLAGSAATAIGSAEARPAKQTGIVNSSKVTGNKLGQEMCKALDIDAKLVRSISIQCVSNTMATVQIERLITVDEGRKFFATLSDEYMVVLKKTGEAKELNTVEITGITSTAVDKARF